MLTCAIFYRLVFLFAKFDNHNLELPHLGLGTWQEYIQFSVGYFYQETHKIWLFLFFVVLEMTQGFIFMLPFILKLFLTIGSWMHPLLRQPLSFLPHDFWQLMIIAQNNLLRLAEYLFQGYHSFYIHKLALFYKELTLLYSLCRKVKLFP